MKRAVRLLLLWLLAMALPVQGVAAATMRFCAPAHQAQRLLFDAPQHAGHTDHASHGSAHGAAAGDPPAGDLAKSNKLQCSACAACCIAVALPSAALTLPVFEPLIERVAFIGASYVGPDATGFERPPRLNPA